jgi:hypothetical protein
VNLVGPGGSPARRCRRCETAKEFGIAVASPQERVEDAVSALARDALDDPPRRDITTTHTRQFTNALSRFAPRRFVDRVILTTMRKSLKGRAFKDPSTPVGPSSRRGSSSAAAERARSGVDREAPSTALDGRLRIPAAPGMMVSCE